jgi:uroporphyrinogen-III decarboxylase
MNGYERIMNAIEGKKNDRVPVWPFVMSFYL